MNCIMKKYSQKKAEKYTKSGTAYFYWEIKNNKRTGRLLKTTDCSSISKVLVIPPQKSDELSLENCFMFSVDYDWYNREIWLTYFFPDYESLPDKNNSYISDLTDIEADSRTKVLWIMEGDYAFLVNNENQKDIHTDFGEDLPETVMKYTIKEIQRMQKGVFGARKILKVILSELKFLLSKKTFNNELMFSYLVYPFES